MNLDSSNDDLQKSPFSLANAPLVRVLAQVRWPLFPAFDVEDVFTQLGKHLTQKYPIGETQFEAQIVYTPEGPQQQSGDKLFRLVSVDRDWIVTLGKVFISLETSAYKGHEDFVARLGEIIRSLTEAFPIPVWSRLGYRYTNRIVENEDIQNLTRYFDPSVLGGLTGKHGTTELVHSVTESLYNIDDARLIVRAARLEAGASVDPTLEPVNDPSWVLDLDAFHEHKSHESLTDEQIQLLATKLSHVASNHLTSVVTTEFLERFK